MPLRRCGTIIAEPTSEAMPSPTLVVTDALGRRFITLDKPLFILGSDRPRLFSLRRHRRVDLRVEDADVSSVHAEIIAKDATFIIRDKKSRFGTFVNGARVTEKVLEHRDSIRLSQSGDTEIVFFIGELPLPGNWRDV
jgi:pSer/pThr/pTyr-binding forkhead associated (FHA) protein